jgi:hypothetical protein
MQAFAGTRPYGTYDVRAATWPSQADRPGSSSDVLDRRLGTVSAVSRGGGIALSLYAGLARDRDRRVPLVNCPPRHSPVVSPEHEAICI